MDCSATRELFGRVHTRLRVEEPGRTDALWKAKFDFRAEDHPVRDRAAWVSSGDPD